jgi:biopolymer transport protein ExbB
MSSWHVLLPRLTLLGSPDRRSGLVLQVCLVLATLALPSMVAAQEAPAGGDQEPTAAAAPAADSEPAEADSLPTLREDISFFSLLFQGGAFMIPILLMSLIAVTFAIERAIALRRTRVLPPGLVTTLGQLGTVPGGFDPKRAYKVCQQYPSAAATVVRAMLLKVGRPHAEVEHTVQEASQREAERLFANVRWLNLAAAVTPLLGLLGTVWGMIVAFHDTTHLAPGQNKAEFLATGIYIALVTTLGGLIVAIPAAIVSHFFEGRVQTLFHQVDELVFSLLPQLERFEGRVRFNRQSDAHESMLAPDADVEPPPVAERSSAAK